MDICEVVQVFLVTFMTVEKFVPEDPNPTLINYKKAVRVELLRIGTHSI